MSEEGLNAAIGEAIEDATEEPKDHFTQDALQTDLNVKAFKEK